MRKALTSLTALMLLVQPSTTQAQDDDWEFHEPEAGRLLAMARYAEGTEIIVQCQDDDLKIIVVGLPPTADERHVFTATRADGRQDSQTWQATPSPNTFTAIAPGRVGRFLRGGGAYELRSTGDRSPPIRARFDLPAQSANLDRVISACRWPLDDERDALAEAPSDAFHWPRQGDSDAPRGRGSSTITGVVHQSCIIRNLRLAECRVDHERPVRARNGRRIVSEMEGTRLVAADPSLVEGRVVYIVTSHVRIRVN